MDVLLVLVFFAVGAAAVWYIKLRKKASPAVTSASPIGVSGVTGTKSK